MRALSSFLGETRGIAFVDDPATLRLRSRDRFAVSPVLRQSLQGKAAEVIVSPGDKGELLQVIAAAARHRLPLTARGGGTANYGQSVPSRGGVLLDMTQISGVLWTRPGRVRVLAGTLMSEIDAVTRPQGWELRIHPSTRSQATVAGFVAGGSGGMGSCGWGMLRDRGNIIALEVMSMEEEPRMVELRGRDVELVHHAYGTNAIITELEMPLAPAWSWDEAIVAFPTYLQAVDFAIQLGHEPGLIKKLISLQEWPIPRLMRGLCGVVPEGHSMVSCMIAEPSREAFASLVADHAGDIVSDYPEGEGPYGQPLYEFAYGHGQMQIQKEDARYTSVQGLFPPEGLAEIIGRVHARHGSSAPLRLELFLSQGRLVAMGSPLVLYESEAQLADLVRNLQAEGVGVANSHTTGVRGVGIKQITERDRAFKRDMDPHGLLNPGQLDFGEEEGKAETALPTTGWRFRQTGS